MATGAPLDSLERANLPLVLENNAVDDDDDADDFAEGRQGSARQRAARQQQLLGPLVRCESDRANPAPQLRLFVNNRQVEFSRLLENSTAIFSDGLERNLVSFRLTLADFAEETADGALEKAAASQNSTASKGLSPTTTTTSTTTTTTTTAKPKAKNAPPKKANSLIKFDDDADELVVRKEDKRKKAKNKASDKKGARKKKPAAGSGDRDKTGDGQLEHMRNAAPANDADDEAEGTENLRAAPSDSGENSGTFNLAGNEQRRQIVTSVVVSPQRERENQSGGGAQQQRRVAYLNSARIRCVSHVPTLGYEMISELGVPLTLLVPASQLVSAALEANRQLSAGQSGSLQSPRAVSVDRLAQASQAHKSFVSYSNSTRQKSSARLAPVSGRVASGTQRRGEPLLASFCLLLVTLLIGAVQQAAV